MSHSPNLTSHDPNAYRTHASFVFSAANSAPVLGLLDPKPGEKIIDLGCGTGEITIAIKEVVGQQGTVIGVDANQSMLDSAASSGPSTIRWIQADIQAAQSFSKAHPEYEAAFDAVFTSATLHWCKDSPEGVVQLIRWLLKPGGRCGVRAALHHAIRAKGIDPVPLDPWYFPTAKQYEKVLQSGGLIPSNVHLVPRPTPLPTTLEGWLVTFARNSFLSSFSDDEAKAIMKEVVGICRVDNYWSDENPGTGVKGSGEGGESGWEVLYVRLRGVGKKP
ncbi:conserved hypothetical protein [Cryptococcus deneoformans JEC21]|uniref:Methyltransferase domain-containing protein n=1 Tax=Cryptococcus deneoformans (strain JEC21 / ATCC MYA-565) TaxID=214684 RepID=Q5KLA3_CRYD1|nr:conserved hypothetical protein [Cryptococcus neoformans var. neoformans JEC21]AAW42081.2 conserved hypothetical protein [Cryptococcus neoformans var. neoformans JEC21]